MLFKNPRPSYKQNACSVGQDSNVNTDPSRYYKHTRRLHVIKKKVQVNRKEKMTSGQLHDADNDEGEIAGSAVKGAQTTSLENYILLTNMYVLYVPIAFAERIQTTASAIATFDYFIKHIMDFSFPIDVFADTPCNNLHERQNDTTKKQVCSTSKNTEDSNHCLRLVWCGLKRARNNFLQSFDECWSSKNNIRKTPLFLTRKADVVLKNSRM